MATQQLLVRLPEELIRRLERQVPAQARSAFVRHVLEQALAPDDGEHDPLFQIALEVEKDEQLSGAMEEWDGTVADGLGPEVASAAHG